jgi:hypothetical protein
MSNANPRVCSRRGLCNVSVLGSSSEFLRYAMRRQKFKGYKDKGLIGH